MDKFSEFFENHMKSNMRNYLDLTVDQVYDVIINVNAWPNHFNKSKKVRFIKALIDHFIEKEEYEKCAKLQKQVDELENIDQTDRHVRDITK